MIQKILLLDTESYVGLNLLSLFGLAGLPVKAVLNPKGTLPPNIQEGSSSKIEFSKEDWRHRDFTADGGGAGGSDFFSEVSTVIYPAANLMWTLQQEQDFIRAMVAAKVRRVVRLEEAHSKNISSGKMVLSEGEKFLQTEALTSICIRSQLGMESLLAGAELVRQKNIFYSSSAGKRVSYVCAADVAVAVIKILALADPKKTYLFTGRQGFTAFEVAAALTQEMGRTIIYQNIQAAQIIHDLTASKAPPALIESISSVLDYVISGSADFCTEDLAELGVPGIGLPEFFKKTKKLFEVTKTANP